MALPASISLPSSSFKSRIVLLDGKYTQNNGCYLMHVHRRPSLVCSMKVQMAQFMDPDTLPIQIGNLREKIQEAVPEPVKSFPWKKAEKIFLERLLFTGKKALKWFLLFLFTYSSLSDCVISIFRNQELMIPIGLFVGILLTDFLKEVSQEIFRSSEESSLKQKLIVISCFFAFVKLISYAFTIQARAQAFLLHVANGSLMQALWLWRNFSRERNEINEQTPFVDEGMF